MNDNPNTPPTAFAAVAATCADAAVLEIMTALRCAAPSTEMLLPIVTRHVRDALQAHTAALELAIAKYTTAVRAIDVARFAGVALGLKNAAYVDQAQQRARAELSAALWCTAQCASTSNGDSGA